MHPNQEWPMLIAFILHGMGAALAIVVGWNVLQAQLLAKSKKSK